MSSKSKRLGSLADVFQAEKLDGTIRTIRIEKISPSEKQPRQDRKKGIEELAQSLANDGLLQPIIVTKSEIDDSYRIVAGERRYHAALAIGWTEIECKILNKADKEVYKIAVIENLQRENLSPYEEAEAIHYLKTTHSYTDLELGSQFGKSRNYMTEILSISNIPSTKLKKCKELGIDNKNLLIQAAIAEKNGDFEGFLKSFLEGGLKTVKDAKSYNQKKKAPPEKNAQPQFQHKYILQKKPDSILIRCENQEGLSELYKFIKKELAKNFG